MLGAALLNTARAKVTGWDAPPRFKPAGLQFTARGQSRQYVEPSGGCGSLRLCGAAISRRSSVSTVSMV